MSGNPTGGGAPDQVAAFRALVAEGLRIGATHEDVVGVLLLGALLGRLPAGTRSRDPESAAHRDAWRRAVRDLGAALLNELAAPGYDDPDEAGERLAAWLPIARRELEAGTRRGKAIGALIDVYRGAMMSDGDTTRGLRAAARAAERWRGERVDAAELGADLWLRRDDLAWWKAKDGAIASAWRDLPPRREAERSLGRRGALPLGDDVAALAAEDADAADSTEELGRLLDSPRLSHSDRKRLAAALAALRADPALTVSALAERLGIGRRTVYDLLERARRTA